MIHPKIGTVFPSRGSLDSFSSWLYASVADRKRLTEFIALHLVTARAVTAEIKRVQNMDLADPATARVWASEFLEGYDSRIRKMRNASSRIFDEFHMLRETEFERIVSESTKNRKEMKSFTDTFLNGKGLLIGKIIFAYREMWFLAKGIGNPDFRIVTVETFQKWARKNMCGLEILCTDLERIMEEGKKRKE